MIRTYQHRFIEMDKNCLIVFCFVLLVIKYIQCSKSEKNLIRSLLKGYEPLARPVKDASISHALAITVTLKQIVDLDERNQILKTKVWLEYYWNDTNLKWKPV